MCRQNSFHQIARRIREPFLYTFMYSLRRLDRALGVTGGLNVRMSREMYLIKRLAGHLSSLFSHLEFHFPHSSNEPSFIQ